MKNVSLCLIASILSTIGITVLGLFIAIAATATRANTGGIGAVAGGVSESLFLFLLISFPVLVFVLFLVFRRISRSR
ncbi:MAG TPA: hypothetical protein VLA93_03005 [Pyrinomonadaceae bacterium]|nr:hypothetical protein [Pyrinomonadaceae bacterium]